jgi:serine/threonine protein kinase
VDDNFRLKLADFGWSRQREKERTTFCGTPDYLAPEMINGTEQTEKLDIWTMGVLMFELLHGKAPFSLNKKFSPRNKLQEIQKDILKGDIVFGRGVSIEAQEIIQAMMSPNPLDRPSAYELLTFPFFTQRYPFLASLNVKTSFINSKFFSKSKLSNIYNESSHQVSVLRKSNREEDVLQMQKDLEVRQKKLDKEQSDFYKRVIEFDKIKEEFKERELQNHSQMEAFRNKQTDFELQLQDFEDRKIKLELTTNAINEKERTLDERERLLLDKEIELVHREHQLDQQKLQSKKSVDKE